MDRMANPNKKRKQGHGPRPDRHKPSRMFRLPSRMADLLDELGEEEIGSSATEQLKNAVREYLVRKGKLSRPHPEP
jgi:hypothetical protein